MDHVDEQTRPSGVDGSVRPADDRVDPTVPETDVANALVRLRTAESQMLRRRRAAQGLGESDASALRYVLERGDDPVTPTEIAVQLGLTTSAVTSLIDRLVRAGLVETSPHASDRRSKVVVPTPAALEADPMTDLVQHVVDDLSTRQRLAIVGFLDRVTDILEQHER